MHEMFFEEDAALPATVPLSPGGSAVLLSGKSRASL
jgi:hypothetical protein